MITNHAMCSGIFFLFLTALGNPAYSSSYTCVEFLSQKTSQKNLVDLSENSAHSKIRKTNRYSSVVQKLSKKDYNFGFEIEFRPHESEGLVRYYEPAAEFGVSHGQWKAMSNASRVEWVVHTMKSLESDRFGHKKKIMQLMPSSNAPGFFPKNFITDYSGSVEFVSSVETDYAGFIDQIAETTKLLGVGSMQAMVSFPKESLFKGSDDAIIGWFVFLAEVDTATKLSAAYARAQINPNVPVAGSFVHPYLGPMVTIRKNMLEEYVVANRNKGRMKPKDLEDYLDLDHTPKLMGATVYRPDIGGEGRAAVEVRNAHKDLAMLRSSIDRVIAHLSFDIEKYASFSKWSVLNKTDDFKNFPDHIQSFLRDVYPNKGPDKIYDDPLIWMSFSVVENFAYPLRDWSRNYNMLNLDVSLVDEAKKAYTHRLKEIELEYKKHKNPRKARFDVQKALAQFFAQSGLAQNLLEWESIQYEGVH